MRPTTLHGLCVATACVVAFIIWLATAWAPMTPLVYDEHCDHKASCCSPGKNYLHKYDCE